ncbi:MAG: VOC family protein [Hyphomicrobiaceae bacterium]
MQAAAAKPDLAYIALASRDSDRVIAFLGDDLELSSFDVELPDGGRAAAFRVGETALIVLAEGDRFLTNPKPGVDHIALAAGDPIAACAASGLELLAIDAAGLNGTHQAAVDRAGTCGVNVRFASALNLPSSVSAMVERIDHIGIASADNGAAETVFCDTFGAVYESRQTDMEVATAMESFTSDKYGAIYHTRAPQIVGGLRVSFLTVGDLELEFLQNFDPAQGFEMKQGSAGTTKQDQSAIGRFVQNRGGGLHHIAFKVGDVDAILARLAGRGHQMIDVVGRPGSRRARIGFVHPSSTGGILFHFVERAEHDHSVTP